MIRSALRDARFWLTGAAFALTAAALAVPRIELTREVYDVLAVVDITGSMNTRDMPAPGAPMGETWQEGPSESRLAAARRALSRLVSSLPCRSRFGLGVFAGRRTFLFFEPAGVCENFAALDGAIRELDWRMAWDGDSLISRGLFEAIAEAQSLGAGLVFLTDGHEAPPLRADGGPRFTGEAGDVRGLIAGVGGRDLSPIPKFDDEGRETGTWGPDEVPHENRTGLPPKDARLREGYTPRNAPFGAAAAQGQEHLSSVRMAYLEALAAATGLSAVALAEQPDLLPALRRVLVPRTASAPTDVRSWPAGLALLAFMAAFLLPPLLETRQRGPRTTKGTIP